MMERSLINNINQDCLILLCILLLLLLSPPTFAQKDFVSIACCANSNDTDHSTNISWITDYTWFPDKTNCHNALRPSPNHIDTTSPDKTRVFDVRYSWKRCYNLETKIGQEYLVRGTFLYYGDATLRTTFFILVGVTNIGRVKSLVDDFEIVEVIFRASKEYVDFCVAKSDEGDPYISKLELRPLVGIGYLNESSSTSSVVLKVVRRVDLGGKKGNIVKYPIDPSDRNWNTSSDVKTSYNTTQVFNENAKISNYKANVRAPLQVLQTALKSDVKLEFVIELGTVGYYSSYRVVLYFLELENSVKHGQRVFDIVINNETQCTGFDIWVDGSNYREVVLDVQANGGVLNLTFVKSFGSDFGPICNAYEIFKVIPWAQETSLNDVQGIMDFKRELVGNNQQSEVLESWSGDPCLPQPWEGLFCETYNNVATIITKLNLSSMGLRGPIPPSITKLTNLTTLNLSYNEFTGQIPPFSPLSKLRSADLRNNNLSGPLPATLAMLPHLVLYIGCNPIVKDHPTSFKNGTRLDTSSESCIIVTDESGTDSSRRGIIIGSVAGGTLILSVAAGIFIVCFYKKKLMPQIMLNGKIPRRNNPLKKKSTGDLIFTLPIIEEIVVKSISIETFTLECIEAATQNYKTSIGEGGFGSVYRGTLHDGQQVAVKVRSSTSTQGTREFQNELNLLSTIFHENLVPLLGYCSENDQEILVYPFMSNGSLQDRLYGQASRRKRLDWPTLLSIALGAARGLSHLHAFGGRGVIHRDVKSSNILLDQSMTPKVADFGFSKYAPQEGDSGASLEVRGTAGYLDPEYYTTHHLSDKSDVFSFGVVLLEIITGREPLNIRRERNEWSLVEWAKQRARESNIEEIVDPSIKKGGYHAEAMWRVVEVALTCVEPYSAYRPCMADVVRELEDALIIENNASEYMRSIESSASLAMENKIIIPCNTPTDASPIMVQALPPPEPR